MNSSDCDSDGSMSDATQEIELECIINNDMLDEDDELLQSVEVKQERIDRLESELLSPSKAPPADAVIVEVPDEIIDLQFLIIVSMRS